MKLSISLGEDDVRVLDEYAERHGGLTRSAVLQRAVRALRTSELEVQYASAIEEWAGSEDAALWDGVSGDGVAGAPR